MRARNIKPAFFKNEILGAMPTGTRLTFIGLWCLADREGRLENRPARIKAELFPYDSEDVRKHIGTLSEVGFLVQYEVGGVGYIEIPNFARHQNPHKQESPSRIPPSSEGVRNKVGSPPADSLLLIPDSPLLKQTPSLPSGAFDQVWLRYPKKHGKPKAQEFFKASVKTMTDFLDIQKALDNYLRSDRVQRGFIQDGERWFKPKEWKIWVEYTEEKNATNGGKGVHSYGAVAERIRETRRVSGLRKLSGTSAGQVLARIRDNAVDQTVVPNTENREPVGE